MKVFIQNALCPGQVLFAFDEVVQPNVERIRWAAAYSTQRGCQRLVTRVTARIGDSQWRQAEKTFITSLDYGITEPNALRFLASLPGSQVLVANPDVVTRNAFAPTRAYHPKVYLFQGGGTTGYVVGSANLTESALIRNTEVVTAGFEIPENTGWNRAWDAIVDSAGPLTLDVLADYESRWHPIRPRVVDPDPAPPLPSMRPGERQVFGDALAASRIAPQKFLHLWVQAGSMSSGGSRNQLELPRGGNAFFGFNFADYGVAHRTIGHPSITIRGRTWTNRPLTWHGHNGMERINLPTRAQGGFDYQHTAIIFRRHEGGFELAVSPWDDAEAIAWRTASESLNAIFRLGERGFRVCGLF